MKKLKLIFHTSIWLINNNLLHWTNFYLKAYSNLFIENEELIDNLYVEEISEYRYGGLDAKASQIYNQNYFKALFCSETRELN